VSQNLSNRWSLLVLCSLFYATFSFMILFIWSPDGLLTLRTFAHSRSSIEQLGLVTLAAGVCTVATGTWNAREANSWLLVLNGLACCALGIMVALGASKRITFRSIALVIVVMGVSIGLYELVATNVAWTSSRRMAADCGRSALGWFRRGVPWLRIWVDQTRTESIRSDLPLAGILLWFQRDLHAGVSPGPLQAAVGHS
jgi:hypothetical protein